MYTNTRIPAEIEQKIHDKVIHDLKLIEDDLVSKLITGEQSILLGDNIEIEGLACHLARLGADVGNDIHYVVIGNDENSAVPVTLTKISKQTGQRTILQVCTIRKSDALLSFIKEDIHYSLDFDPKRLLTIELEKTEKGNGITAKFLDKTLELTEDNIKVITGSIFNPERSFKQIMNEIRKEEENQSIMYG